MEWVAIESDKQVLNWLDEIEPPPTRPLPGYLSFVDSVPPNPPVFTGVIRVSLDRYQAMADHTWRIACPAAVFGADVVHDVSYDSNVQPAAEVAPSLLPSTGVLIQSANPASSTISTVSASSRRGDQSRSSTKRKAEAEPPRNKFIPITSPVMPTSTYSWLSASQTIGRTFNNLQPQRRGVSRDYVLPEPALFANHSSESSCQAFFKLYLKVREVLLYNIATRGPLAC